MSRKEDYGRSLDRRDFLRYGMYGGFAVCLPGSAWLAGCSKERHETKANIVLVTVDTLRADHLSCYGYGWRTSPNLDRFAADALLFENCLSHAPVTSSSLASILTGFLPHETEVFENMPLPEGPELLSEVLWQNGYKTFAVVSNFNLRARVGWARGFHIYDDKMEDYEEGKSLPERIAEHTTDRAIDLLNKFSNDRLFLWVHYQDPHGPYTPPDRFGRRFRTIHREPRPLRANASVSGYGGIPSYQRLGTNRDYSHYVSQYDAEIAYQDEQFNRLMKALQDLGLYDEALILFTADHGEGMGEHDYYFAHGENLYSGLTHVPLIVKYGDRLTGRRKDFVQHIDIVPTILNVAGLRPDSRFRGSDLGGPCDTEREIFAEMKSPMARDGVKFSIVAEGFKLIYTPFYDQYELFDLGNDPYEEHSIIRDVKHGARVEDLKQRLDRIRQENLLGSKVVHTPRKLTQGEIKKLKSLGYVR